MKSSEQKEHPFWDFWGPILLTISLYTGIRHFVAEARYIPSGSMLPGLQVNDRLIIEKITFWKSWKRPLRRGDIVVFKSPYSFDPLLARQGVSSPLKCSFVTFPLISFVLGSSDPSCDAYIKRVVAVGGDKILVDQIGKVFLNDKEIVEPYVESFCFSNKTKKGLCQALSVVVPNGKVVVLGDNRRNSWDSRFWPGGPFLPEKKIIGRALWRFWPLNRFGSLDS